jgi:hypothetical protein
MFLAGAIVGLFLATMATAAGAAEVVGEDHAEMARYAGAVIDLTEGWGTADACVVHPEGTDCFDTMAEAAEFDAELSASSTTCSSSLRLFDGQYRTGRVLYVSDRLVWVNLSARGFDNVTRSFQVGACASRLAAGTNGGGGIYRDMRFAAGHQENVMAAGWDRAISSVYLH